MPYVASPVVNLYSTGTTAGYIDPWYSWNTTRTWSTNTTTNTWVEWNSPFATTMTSTTNILTFGSGQVTPAELYRVDGRPVFIEDQRTEAEWAAIREIRETERRIRERANRAARVEASKLLAMVLTKPQMADYQAKKYFDVVGSEGGIYRISHGTSGNISQIVDGREINRLCVHPVLYDDGGYLPTEDCLAAQALALMHDERGVVNRANVHAGVRHLRAA